MGMGGSITLLVVCGLIVAVCLVLITDAAAKVNSIPDYSSNSDLNDASKYLTWMTVTAWIVLVLVLIGVGMVIYYGKKSGKSGGLVVNALLVFLIILIFAMGIMAAISADKIYKSGVSNSGDGKTAYNDCVVVAILSLTSIGLLIIMGILILVQKHKKDKIKHGFTEAVRTGNVDKLKEIISESSGHKKGHESSGEHHEGSVEHESHHESSESHESHSGSHSGSGSSSSMSGSSLSTASKFLKEMSKNIDPEDVSAALKLLSSKK